MSDSVAVPCMRHPAQGKDWHPAIHTIVIMNAARPREFEGSMQVAGLNGRGSATQKVASR